MFLEKVQQKNIQQATVRISTTGTASSPPPKPTANTNNYMIMIDKSGSMALGKPTRWAQSARVSLTVTSSCLQHSPEGIDVYFFGSPDQLETYPGLKSKDDVQQIFQSKKHLGGTTALEGALAKGFATHFARPLSVPTSILVITDGWPNSKSSVIHEITNASKKCQTTSEISISLMQVGNDDKCKEFFKKLEKAQSKGKFPNIMVDCLNYTQVQNLGDFVSNSLK